MHRLKTLITNILPKFIGIRHRLHQMPELKYEEVKTASLVAEELISFGIDITPGIAKTGITAIIDSGRPGKTVALRADMDALPLQEETGVPYQSQENGKMHACGHDGHTATLLLVGYLLQQMKDQFQGRVKLIFQPAEEGGKGSTALIEEGVLEHPSVDAIFGWHVWPGLELGKIATKAGAILAGTGRFEIQIHGRIAHTSMPEKAINPVTIGASLISAIANLRNQYLNQYAIINILRFESGESKGGMTDFAKIIGVYYIEHDDLLSSIKSDIVKVIESMASVGAEININYFPFHTPTINSKTEADLVLNTASKLFDKTQVVELTSVMTAAEDFSEYLHRVPGCFLLIGAGLDAPNVHTNQFDFPDAILPTAALLMCQIAITYLNARG